MRIKNFYRAFCSTFLILLLFVNALPQCWLGPQGFTCVRAPELPKIISITLSKKFFPGVGGGAFNGVAFPVQRPVVNNIKPGSSLKLIDGNRLPVAINGGAVFAPIYNGPLVPLIKFAGSEDLSCPTLPGGAAKNIRQQPTKRLFVKRK